MAQPQPQPQQSLTQAQLRASGLFSDEAAAVRVAGIPPAGIRGHDLQRAMPQGFMLSR